jgi:hypothetical protein
VKAIITGIPKLTDSQQQELGRAWLLHMFAENIKVDGVYIEFIEDTL